MLMEVPFEISQAFLKVIKRDGRDRSDLSCKTKEEPMTIDNFLKMKLNRTTKEKKYGVTLEMLSEHQCELELTIWVNLYKRDVCPKTEFVIVEK